MSTFLSNAWQGLQWSDWMPLDAPSAQWRTLPTGPGLCRVRPEAREVLAYIGQTGRSLKTRLGELRYGVFKSDVEMPWNDPHTAAPHLWALRMIDGMQFECSAAPADLDIQQRKATEDMLLWRYRLEKGESTLCNHGRFHPLFTRPSNRKQGYRSQRLEPGLPNPAAGASLPPLVEHGQPADEDWMGLAWSLLLPLDELNFNRVPPGPAVYKVLDCRSTQLLYVGETSQLRSRLVTHRRREWSPFSACASWHLISDTVASYQRHEVETDLLGAYFAQSGRAPVFQYLNTH